MPLQLAPWGKSDDDMAVVDTKARVYGADALRVADASIFPFCPPGHSQVHRLHACREDCGWQLIRNASALPLPCLGAVQ